MSSEVESRSETSSDGTIGGLAQGGLLNLVGMVVTGLSNFGLVWIVTARLGARNAGIFLVSVGVFSICQKICEAGAGTGLVRFIAAYRVTDRDGDVVTATRVALVPVAILGVAAAVGLFAAADTLARWFADSDDVTAVTDVLRTIAPFLAIAPLYMVMINATRGFGTMVPQVTIERLGRSLFQPVSALVIISTGGEIETLALFWAASFLLMSVPASLTLLAMLRTTHSHEHAQRPTREVASEFWRFTLPRSGGQFFEVGVQWADTLFVGAFIGTTAAGIYAAGSRFLLFAIYVADALIQVISPRLAGLLAAKRHTEASKVLTTATGWQVLLVWPAFLVVFTYASVLLGFLGDEFDVAEPALRWLAAAALVAAFNGPSVSVILMGGRSGVALANTAVAFTVNIVGNVVLVPAYGIAGAGATWAATIIVASSLPAIESRTLFDVQPWGPSIARAALLATGTMGVACVAGRMMLGDTVVALGVSTLTGTALYVALLLRRADEYGLNQLITRPAPIRQG